MAYPKPFNTLEIYLNLWVKVASGGRVELRGGVEKLSRTGCVPMTYENTGYLVFKCNTCQDNWHVGLENFVGTNTVGTDTKVPSVLSDWVKKHRHVCKQHKIGGDHSLCAECKWPYKAHEESWLNTTKHSTYVGLPVKSGGQTLPKSMTLKQFTGRKFRDVEAPCESQDTSQKISHE